LFCLIEEAASLIAGLPAIRTVRLGRLVAAKSPVQRPVSVVVPTIGRAALLEACLSSVAECRPRAADILVVDQSGGQAVASVVTQFADDGARLLRSTVRDRSLAVNQGMREAHHEVVLVTDDDCTVAPTWVETAWAQLSRDPDSIVTGRVLPVGDAVAVPSLVGANEPHDYTGESNYDVLFGCNMACSRSRFLSLGGFDERVKLAEDNDFCYRWLKRGGRLHYDPSLLIWHHAWRTPAELERHFRGYARGQGIFYAKHLRDGDLEVLRFLVRDLRRAVRGLAARIVRGRSEWPDARLALPRGVTGGLFDGWRAFSSRGRSRAAAVASVTPDRGP
jgi:GT2 family glycosyltransferase